MRRMNVATLFANLFGAKPQNAPVTGGRVMRHKGPKLPNRPHLWRGTDSEQSRRARSWEKHGWSWVAMRKAWHRGRRRRAVA